MSSLATTFTIATHLGTNTTSYSYSQTIDVGSFTRFVGAAAKLVATSASGNLDWIVEYRRANGTWTAFSNGTITNVAAASLVPIPCLLPVPVSANQIRVGVKKNASGSDITAISGTVWTIQEDTRDSGQPISVFLGTDTDIVVDATTGYSMTFALQGWPTLLLIASITQTTATAYDLNIEFSIDGITFAQETTLTTDDTRAVFIKTYTNLAAKYARFQVIPRTGAQHITAITGYISRGGLNGEA